jgi:hypothetical protein
VTTGPASGAVSDHRLSSLFNDFRSQFSTSLESSPEVREEMLNRPVSLRLHPGSHLSVFS